MKNKKEKQKKLQWHPAFCSALRLELLEDAENLEFTDEFQLTEKPLQIDCTVVKVKKDCKIKNEIGKIFRKHNIFEYKSPKHYTDSRPQAVEADAGTGKIRI